MKNRGFSLVELSVVLVIIGILIGGIIMGKSLIDASRRTAVISDWQKYSTAANSYFTKYGYWPGDDAEVQNKWGGTYTNGSGDGNLGDKTSTEYYLFWLDLSLANFITGSFTGLAQSVPPEAISSSYMTHYYDYLNPSNQAFYISGSKTFGYTNGVGDTSFGISILTPRAALAIDSKIDDGLAASGNVQAPNGCAYTNNNTPACNIYYIYKK